LSLHNDDIQHERLTVERGDALKVDFK
jgi:hypothetical protein